MSLTINLPSIDVSVAEWVVVDKFEDIYKNIRYYFELYFTIVHTAIYNVGNL